MRTICIALPTLNICLVVVVLIEHVHGDGSTPRFKIKTDMLGLFMIVCADVCLIAYYSIDPGFQHAVAGGYFSPQYAGGLISLIFVGAGMMSGAATGLLVGVWVSVRAIGGVRVMGLTYVAWWSFAFISAWFVVFFSLSSVAIGNQWSQAAFLAVSGCAFLLMGAMAVTVLVLGELVIRSLTMASKFKSSSRDGKILRSIRRYYLAYGVVQVLCAAGLYAGLWFEPLLSQVGPVFIWVGVAYPGLLLSW
jgi:hypothetical protein